jgi:hypothetical protein
MVTDQLIPFHKPNKKMRSEKMMDYFIHQPKHVVSEWSIISYPHQIYKKLREMCQNSICRFRYCRNTVEKLRVKRKK